MRMNSESPNRLPRNQEPHPGRHVNGTGKASIRSLSLEYKLMQDPEIVDANRRLQIEASETQRDARQYLALGLQRIFKSNEALERLKIVLDQRARQLQNEFRDLQQRERVLREERESLSAILPAPTIFADRLAEHLGRFGRE